MARKAPSPRKQALKVTLSKGVLTVSIGVETLKWAAEHHETHYHPQTDKGALVVSDANEFAKDVRRALLNEQEDGTTLPHVMLDAAIDHVAENGSDGFDFDAMDVLEDAERAETSRAKPHWREELDADVVAGRAFLSEPDLRGNQFVMRPDDSLEAYGSLATPGLWAVAFPFFRLEEDADEDVQR